MTRSQRTLAGTSFEKYTKVTRRAQFLAEIDRVVPWRELCVRIDPVYPKPGSGRPPVGMERMLRMYFLQHWFNLSGPAVEEALYDSPTMRAFVGIDLGREPVPDETTVCKFRHLLEEHGFGRALFDRHRAPAHAGRHGEHRHHRGRDDHRRAFRPQRTPPTRAIPGCIRRRRAGSGTWG